MSTLIQFHVSDIAVDETIELLGHTYAFLPDDKEMCREILDQITVDVNKGEFVHISADELLQIANGGHVEATLDAYIQENMEEIYADMHNIDEVYAIKVDGNTRMVYAND